MEQYTEIWQSEIGKNPKLTNYSQIKSEWGPANYEVANLDKGKCCLTARLMLRVLPIAAETGQFARTPREECLCKICNEVNTIETELHYLLDCKEYNSRRLELNCRLGLDLIASGTNSNINKLQILSEHPYIMSNYIYDLWQIRNKVN